ncbi:asparagine synthase-related protein [Wenyingzhuangia sp. IMCC45533]
MKQIRTSIIPHKPTFVKIKGHEHELDYKAICVFSAIGFFLDTDTYWKDLKVLPPATLNKIDDEGYWISSEPWFKWHYTPQNINLKNATNQFAELFEKIVEKQSKDKNIILPLSGGLDSRSQAVALNKLGVKANSYSYSFEGGYKESKISKKIAEKCNFNFTEFTIKKSYLWGKIDDLAKINQCYSEFTHPRQMAVINEVAELGNSFSLGHWGDVLFDSDGYSNNVSDKKLVEILKKKIIKKGGLELAKSLWSNWKLEGNFEEYLNVRILDLLSKIEICNTNAKVRAFKSLYWAPRWTSVNLSIFENTHEINLPYYQDEMCQFICTIPEEILAERKIQIEYIKQTNSEVAKILWQDARPFNLYNYHLAKFPYNFPYRVFNKMKRFLESLSGQKFVQRNWELQFLGKENQEELNKKLFNSKFIKHVESEIPSKYIHLFNSEDSVYYSHAVSTLLTLSVFLSNMKDEKN